MKFIVFSVLVDDFNFRNDVFSVLIDDCNVICLFGEGRVAMYLEKVELQCSG